MGLIEKYREARQGRGPVRGSPPSTPRERQQGLDAQTLAALLVEKGVLEQDDVERAVR